MNENLTARCEDESNRRDEFAVGGGDLTTGEDDFSICRNESSIMSDKALVNRNGFVVDSHRASFRRGDGQIYRKDAAVHRLYPADQQKASLIDRGKV